MGFLDRFLGRDEAPPPPPARARSEDELALDRYRYMLRTAPPDQIERAHEEAFERLTPDQRQLLLQELSAQVPPGERAHGDDPRALARMATRAEMRQPGTIERALGGVPVGAGYGGGFGGFGSILGATLLGSLVGNVLGTAIAGQFFADDAGYADEPVADQDYADADADQDLDVDADLGDAGGDMI